MKCTLSDSLEWLYPDSSIAGEPVTALECDAPAGGVADVNILVTDAQGATLAFTADNNEATRNLYEAFLAHLREEGFDPKT